MKRYRHSTCSAWVSRVDIDANVCRRKSFQILSVVCLAQCLKPILLFFAFVKGNALLRPPE